MKPIKARIKRIARHNEDYHNSRLDKKYVNINFMRFPELESVFTFGFDKLGYGWWRTTEIKDMFWNKDSIDIVTKNSVYRLLQGWKEDE